LMEGGEREGEKFSPQVEPGGFALFYPLGEAEAWEGLKVGG